MTAIHIVCFGNYWQGDDGFGFHLFRRLYDVKLPAQVKLFEGGIAGLSALAFFEGCGKVILVDAIKSGREPGTLHRFLLNECEPPGEEFSTHSMGVNHILAALLVIFEPGLMPEVVVIGAEVGRINPFTNALTPRVKAALDGAVSLVETECMNQGEF